MKLPFSKTHAKLSIRSNTFAVKWETFEGENFRELVKSTIFVDKPFADCSSFLS